MDAYRKGEGNEMLSPKEALSQGADAIEQYGHIKNDYGDPEVGFCAAGSVRWAITGKTRGSGGSCFNGNAEALDVYVAAMNLLPFARGGVAAWNDNPRTTKDEVIRTMRESAA